MAKRKISGIINATEHPMNLGRSARRVLLHGCEQIAVVCLEESD